MGSDPAPLGSHLKKHVLSIFKYYLLSQSLENIYGRVVKPVGKFSIESKEPIEEATEEEIEDLDRLLHNLDPKDLSFNNIFGDKMRLAVPLDERTVTVQ